jgi:hypothetical protein
MAPSTSPPWAACSARPSPPHNSRARCPSFHGLARPLGSQLELAILGRLETRAQSPVASLPPHASALLHLLPSTSFHSEDFAPDAHSVLQPSTLPTGHLFQPRRGGPVPSPFLQTPSALPPPPCGQELALRIPVVKREVFRASHRQSARSMPPYSSLLDAAPARRPCRAQQHHSGLLPQHLRLWVGTDAAPMPPLTR